MLRHGQSARLSRTTRHGQRYEAQPLQANRGDADAHAREVTAWGYCGCRFRIHNRHPHDCWLFPRTLYDRRHRLRLAQPRSQSCDAAFPYDIPDLPERVPKRIALISTIGSCPELADLGDYGSAVTQFEALERNPIQMTWSVLETLPCVIVLKQSAADAARYAQVLRSAGYAGIIFMHVPKSVSRDALDRLVDRNAASIDGATSDTRAVVRLY